MESQERIVRAREAHIATNIETDEVKAEYRAGLHDSTRSVMAVMRALADIAKPLSEVVPIDEDLIAAREIAARFLDLWNQPGPARAVSAGEDDYHPNVRSALAGIKRGRELAALR